MAADLVRMPRCIATDDPRLKEKWSVAAEIQLLATATRIGSRQTERTSTSDAPQLKRATKSVKRVGRVA